MRHHAESLRFIREETLFVERIRWMMFERKVSCAELAKVLDVTPQMISLYVTGHSVMGIDKAIKLADYFNVDINWLFAKKSEKM